MKKVVWISLTAITISIIAAIFIWLYTFRKADLTVSSQKAVAEISSTELRSKFESNEDESNKAYLGKVLVVDGRIDKISEDSTNISVYLKEVDETSGVMCDFNKSITDISVLKTGERLRVKGICTGYLMDVNMNKCSVEK